MSSFSQMHYGTGHVRAIIFTLTAASSNNLRPQLALWLHSRRENSTHCTNIDLFQAVYGKNLFLLLGFRNTWWQCLTTQLGMTPCGMTEQSVCFFVVDFLVCVLVYSRNCLLQCFQKSRTARTCSMNNLICKWTTRQSFLMTLFFFPLSRRSTPKNNLASHFSHLLGGGSFNFSEWLIFFLAWLV